MSNKLQHTFDLQNRLKHSLKLYFSEQEHKLNLFENFIINKDPKKILKFGYSITRINGKIVKSATEINENEVLETEFCDGKKKSKVIYTKVK